MFAPGDDATSRAGHRVSWATPEVRSMSSTQEDQASTVSSTAVKAAAVLASMALVTLPLVAEAKTKSGYVPKAKDLPMSSYYASLTCFALSFPGIISLVTRSVKSKVVRKCYRLNGPAVPGGKNPMDVQSEILAYFQTNNYRVADFGDSIIFEGRRGKDEGQAVFLSFCCFISFLILGQVMKIVEQQVNVGIVLDNWWYSISLLSPLAGKYYLDNVERLDQVSVLLNSDDDDFLWMDLYIQGDEKEIDRFQKTLDLREKGMIYVKGIFDS